MDDTLCVRYIKYSIGDESTRRLQLQEKPQIDSQCIKTERKELEEPLLGLSCFTQQ